MTGYGGGVANTRRSFLDAQLDPILGSEHTLASLLNAIDEVYSNLASLGIYDKVAFGLDAPRPIIFSSRSCIDLDATMHLTSAKRFLARTGTDIGNGEGGGYANFSIKNMFGGAEYLSMDATLGTRTRSSYVGQFSTPINNSARWRAELSAYSVDRAISWASHEQVIRGLAAKIKSTPSFSSSTSQELGYEFIWRTLSATADYTSATVRDQLGTSIKSSVYHTIAHDTRDNHLAPTKGFYLKATQEIAGLGGHGTPYIKSSFESQAATGTANKRVSASVGARGGLLWMSQNQLSCLADRFFLGGPNDVRGFYLNSLGPRDGSDYVGGDSYFAWGVNVLTKLPKLDEQNPLRAQWFLNGGSVLPLDHQNVGNTIKQLVKYPSVATGLGLVYIHPAARFELNFTLPLIARQTDGIRKGIQFGVGISFL